jgi:hypothetical protein
MVGLIPFVHDDYLLTVVYIVIVGFSFIVRREKKDFVAFVFGFVIMIVAEFFFIQTGVEIFVRNTLFGIMPLWLPLLWAYAFVVIKREIKLLEL